jgi:V/A-type H+-transporting ATPase subunit I
MRIAVGLASVYGVVGYVSDVLSYSRLLALGMATGVVAMVINELARIVIGFGWAGYFAAILILVIGHGFNLVINTLGAYIHSSRLQYVEFFSKFFEGGGRAFKPLAMKNRFVEVDVSD